MTLHDATFPMTLYEANVYAHTETSVMVRHASCAITKPAANCILDLTFLQPRLVFLIPPASLSLRRFKVILETYVRIALIHCGGHGSGNLREGLASRPNKRLASQSQCTVRSGYSPNIAHGRGNAGGRCAGLAYGTRGCLSD